MKYAWNDSLRTRIAKKLADAVIREERDGLEAYLEILNGESVNTAYWRNDLAEFIGWLAKEQPTGSIAVIRELARSAFYEWDNAHAAASNFRSALSVLTDWSPTGENQ